MKKLLILCLLSTSPCTLLASNICANYMGELARVEKELAKLSDPKSGENLLKLQDAYDKEIAEYNIYKTIEALRSSYASYVRDIDSLNLGDKTGTWGEVKNFVKSLYGANKNVKVKDLQKFRMNVRDGLTATSGILVMEDMFNKMLDHSLQSELEQKGMNYSGEEFLVEVKTLCDRKNNFETSPLCKEMFVKDRKGNLVESRNKASKKMVLGFFDAYKAVKRNVPEEQAYKKLQNYKEVLLKEMPNTKYMQDQLIRIDRLDRSLTREFAKLREDVKTDVNANITVDARKAVTQYIDQYEKSRNALSVGNDKLIGRQGIRQSDMLTEQLKYDGVKDRFGNMGEIARLLNGDIEQNLDKLIGIATNNLKISHARKSISTGINIPIEEFNPQDELHNALADTGIKQCSDVDFGPNLRDKEHYRTALYECMRELAKVSDAPLDKKIYAAKDNARDIKNKIARIERSKDYQMITALKDGLVNSLKLTCPSSLDGKNCKDATNLDRSVLQGQEGLKLVTNSLNQVVALIDDSKPAKANTEKAAKRIMKKECGDTYFAAMAPTYCANARTTEQKIIASNDFYYDVGKDGSKINPRPRPTDNLSMIINAAADPIHNVLAPSFINYRWTNVKTNQMENWAKYQKLQNYQNQQMWEQWQNSFPSIGMWGSPSLYPTYFNPLSMYNFNYAQPIYFNNPVIF